MDSTQIRIDIFVLDYNPPPLVFNHKINKKIFSKVYLNASFMDKDSDLTLIIENKEIFVNKSVS